MVTCKISATVQPQPSEFVASLKMKNLILKAKRQPPFEAAGINTLHLGDPKHGTREFLENTLVIFRG